MEVGPMTMSNILETLVIVFKVGASSVKNREVFVIPALSALFFKSFVRSSGDPNSRTVRKSFELRPC